jgi:hypothetical protein
MGEGKNGERKDGYVRVVVGFALLTMRIVLGQYHAVISTLPGRMQAWTSDVKIAIDAFKPDADFRAMIENNRIGNFRPTPHVYESLDSDEPEVSFGIDLRKWAGSNWKAILRDSGNEKNGAGKGSVPSAFMALLKGLEMKYPEVSDDCEYLVVSHEVTADDGHGIPVRRKSWIFLVDLRETHELRERLNDPRVPLADMLDEVAKFNAPVIAATSTSTHISKSSTDAFRSQTLAPRAQSTRLRLRRVRSM